VRYVVTGAAGFIGSHLAEALVVAGHDVLGVDSYTGYYARARKETNAAAAGIAVLELDLAETTLEPLLAGTDGIFHLAGQPGVRASWGESFQLYLDRNVRATQRVFQAAAAAGVRVVFASSSSVYGDAETYPTPEDVVPQPISPYGITKLACEQLAVAIERALGLEAVVLRYFTVYGPRQRPDMAFTAMLEALARGERFRLFGDGSAARSFTYVGDAVAATIAAMSCGRRGETYNVGGGDEATMNEAIALVEEVSGRSLDVERVEAAAGDVKRTKADVSKAAAELNWAPATTLREGLQAQWEWAAAVESPA
jgi:nucleoside-diphosphate-sugar epimerase